MLLFFFLPSLVHRTYVSLISLVSFWIFVLVDISTYLSPILTIMPPRIEESVCRETIVTDSFINKDIVDFQFQDAGLFSCIKHTFVALNVLLLSQQQALTLYLSLQLDGFPLLKEPIESHLQLRKTSCIQRLRKTNGHWTSLPRVSVWIVRNTRPTTDITDIKDSDGVTMSMLTVDQCFL